MLTRADELTACRDSAPDDLIQQEETTDALVFVKTDGRRDAQSVVGLRQSLQAVADRAGWRGDADHELHRGQHLRTRAVSFDGKKILFSMRPPGGSNRNIYEINADGTGLRQVTSGGGHDFDPLYLPGRPRSCSPARATTRWTSTTTRRPSTCTRATWTAATSERISFNQSDDFDPDAAADGRIVYTRWEHFGTMNRFPLFFTNPDGTRHVPRCTARTSRNFFHAAPTPDGRIDRDRVDR